MKIIIVGATGFVGHEVLAQCRSHVSISSIVVLTRRPLSPEILSDPKVTSVVIDNFLEYSDEAKAKLEGATAAIWALRASSPQVELDYPIAFARTTRALRLSATDPFRYMHLSGRLAEKDQTKPLWFLQDARRAKGLAEIKLMEFTSRDVQTGSWETYIARPSMIVPNPPGAFNSLAGWAVGAIRVDQLAKVMIDIVQEGSEHEIFENTELIRHANRMNPSAG